MTESNKKFSRSDMASLLAVLLSISALAIGIVEARIMADQQAIMAEQQKGSVWPYIEVRNDFGVTDGLSFNATAENKGVGPAILIEASITLKEKTYNTFDAFRAAMDSLIGREKYNLMQFGVSQTTKSVYTPGEKKTLFSIDFLMDQKEFFEKVGTLNLSLKYCSIYGDCWRENGQEIDENDQAD